VVLEPDKPGKPTQPLDSGSGGSQGLAGSGNQTGPDYEKRKKMLEARVQIIEALLKNQVSPVMALDQLAEAVERTHFVWLSNLDQREAILNMNGTSTSLNAIADFYTNLNATGYFKNIDIGPSQESSGNFTFSLKCEFAPPRSVAATNAPATAPIAGAN
jgi:Tfp pilus assembly protein PilN